jgi:hypothetical protein
MGNVTCSTESCPWALKNLDLNILAKVPVGTLADWLINLIAMLQHSPAKGVKYLGWTRIIEMTYSYKLWSTNTNHINLCT